MDEADGIFWEEGVSVGTVPDLNQDAYKKIDEWRTRAVASFPDGRAATMLAAARYEFIAEGSWGQRRYMDVKLLQDWDERRDMEE